MQTSLLPSGVPFFARLFDSAGLASNATRATLVITKTDGPPSHTSRFLAVASVSSHTFYPKQSLSALKCIDMQFEEAGRADMYGQLIRAPSLGNIILAGTAIVAILLYEDGAKIISESAVYTDEISVALRALGIFPEGMESLIPGDIVRYIFFESTPLIKEPVLERSDFLKTRFSHSSEIIWIADANPTPAYKSAVVHYGALLGSILFRPSSQSHDAVNDINTLFQNRGCDPPLIARELALKRTLVWVRPGSQYDQRRTHFATIAALGLSVIAVDCPGSWLADHTKMHASGITDAERPFAFIPLDLNDTTDLTARLVEAVRAWESQTAIHVDGITTLDDELLVTVCCAALDLGLSVPGSVDAVEACVDKFQMRKLLPWNGLPIYLVKSREDVSCAIANGVHFPAIMKPRSGCSSNGVFKVLSAEELYVLWDNEFSEARRQAIIEPFVSGPEVDVNLIMENGKILFWEISDNEPTVGDNVMNDTADAHTRTFKEVAMSVPSTLPPSSQERLLAGAEHALQALGFAAGTGMFHTEARLDEVTGAAFTIEVNVRNSGRNWAQLVQRVWGVDEVACQFLGALGRPLAQATHPFNTPAVYGAYLRVAAVGEGVLANDPLEFVRGRDDVFGSITQPKGWEIVPHRTFKPAIAHCYVVSGDSMGDCRKRRFEVERLISPKFD